MSSIRKKSSCIFGCSELGSEKLRRVGVDEQNINFRPSPNFRNMKKYLKLKIDGKESTSGQSPPPVALESSPSPNKVEKDIKSPKIAQVIQPPLPLDPPPPDSPPDLILTLKKELEDIEEEKTETNESIETNEELITEFKSDKSESPEKPKPTICRDFIRGSCARTGTCKYVHKFDLSQLSGVFTFCRNYQNSKCTFRQCKYVHATVFEEQNFYRTGMLPPNALSHQRKVNVLPPPPPPPPEETTKADTVPPVFSNPPPPLHVNISTDNLIGIGKHVPMNNIQETRPLESDVRNNVPVTTSPLKEWHERDPGVTISPHGNENAEKPVKTCNNCQTNEFRLQYNKKKVEKMLQESQTNSQKMNQLIKKNQKLYQVLLTLLKPNNKTGLSGGLAGTQFNTNGDKEEMLLEQLSEYFAANRSPDDKI